MSESFPILGFVNEQAEFTGDKELRRELARHCKHPVKVEVKRVYKQRSNQQCRAVMGFWMDIILKETGHSIHEKESVYNAIKTKCWYTEIPNKKTGEVMQVAKKTRESDIEEYSRFMESFRLFVADFFSIHLPDPDATRAMI